MGDLRTGSGGNSIWFDKKKMEQVKSSSPTPTVSPPQQKPQTTTGSTGTSTPPSKTQPQSLVSDEEQSKLESGIDKTTSGTLVKNSQSLPSPGKLTEVSPEPEPEPVFSRCSVDLPDDLDVYPTPSGPKLPMISNRVLSGLVNENGEINVEDLMSLIPTDSDNLFVPSRTIGEGSKYQFIAQDYRGFERSVEIKFHSPDDGAYARFGHCNSGDYWTAQIRVDGRLLNTSGNLQYGSTNSTHIPVLFGPLPQDD